MTENKEISDFIKSFAASANNIVMKGSFTGDDILVAARFMAQCHDIVKTLESTHGKPKTDG